MLFGLGKKKKMPFRGNKICFQVINHLNFCLVPTTSVFYDCRSDGGVINELPKLLNHYCILVSYPMIGARGGFLAISLSCPILICGRRNILNLVCDGRPQIKKIERELLNVSYL